MIYEIIYPDGSLANMAQTTKELFQMQMSIKKDEKINTGYNVRTTKDNESLLLDNEFCTIMQDRDKWKRYDKILHVVIEVESYYNNDGIIINKPEKSNSYYKEQLKQINPRAEYGVNIQIKDEEGNQTKNMKINKESAKVLIDWLKLHFN